MTRILPAKSCGAAGGAGLGSSAKEVRAKIEMALRPKISRGVRNDIKLPGLEAFKSLPHEQHKYSMSLEEGLFSAERSGGDAAGGKEGGESEDDQASDQDSGEGEGELREIQYAMSGKD